MVFTLFGYACFISHPAAADAADARPILLESVQVANLETGHMIFVRSNRIISNFKTFTLEAPPRIVFDLFGVKSPYRKEQAIDVATDWVDRIRYYGHKDKLRIVVETKESYLSAFTADPVETGFRISIGKETQSTAPESNRSESGSAKPDEIESTADLPEQLTTKSQYKSIEKTKTEPSGAGDPEDTKRPYNRGKTRETPKRVIESDIPDPKEIVGDRLDFFYTDKKVQRFSLKQTIETALAANIGMKVSKEESKAALAIKKSQRANFYPTIGGSYQYTRVDEGFNIGGFAQGPKDDYKLTTTVTQPLFSGFSLINQYKIASLGHDIAKVSETLQRQDVILQAKSIYFNLLKAQKLLNIAEQTVKQISAQREVAKNFYEVGMSPLNDFLQAEVELANAKQDRIVASNNLETAKSEFNTLLRRPLNTPVELEDMLFYKPFGWKLEESLGIAETRRLELDLSDMEIGLADKEVALAKRDFFPTVNLQGVYFKEGTKPNVNGGDGVFDPEGWTLSAIASWDFWEWGKKTYGVKEKLARLEQAKQKKTALQDQIRFEVKQAYLKNIETEINIITIQKAIEQAEENLRINQERFKEQVATTTDVLIAQTLLARTQINYYNALYDFKISKAALYRAMGLEVME